MKKLILFLIICFSFSGFTRADYSLSFSAWTHHSNMTDVNNQNNMVALEFNNLIVAKFDNSYWVETYMAGKMFPLIGDNAGVILGVTYGYDSRCMFGSEEECPPIGFHEADFNPFASLYYSPEYRNIKLTYLEAVKYRTIAVGFTFDMEWS